MAMLSDNPYDGLLVDDAHWAFGTGFSDPLMGVPTEVPAGVSPSDLAALCLALGDDALVFGHRLSEWCSRAPDLEEDIALANISLDLIGQARWLLARAAEVAPSVVPKVEGSPAPPEDLLAFFRSASDFRSSALAAHHQRGRDEQEGLCRKGFRQPGPARLGAGGVRVRRLHLPRPAVRHRRRGRWVRRLPRPPG